MLPFASRDLPGTGGQLSVSDCEEVLARPLSGAGGHCWVRVGKDGLSTQQARAAVARAVGIDAEQVALAGSRQRHGRCRQWFSIPAELVDHPAGLRNAGYQSKMKVLEITAHDKAITAAMVTRLRWSLRLRGAVQGEGYHKARAILDRLRQVGCPNYVAAGRLGKDGNLVRWGRLLLREARLPGAVAASGFTPGQCLAAFQWSLFNRYLAARVSDDRMAACLDGERVLTGRGDEQLADDREHAQKRLDSWEAVQLGPLYGKGMSAVAGEAAAREAAILAEAELDPAQLTRLRGDRRPIRFQPTKTSCDLDGKDLLISAELPTDSYAAVLVEEIVKPEHHLD